MPYAKQLYLMAVNGTDRQAQTVETVHPSVDQILKQLESSEQAQQLLLSVGATYFYEQAGYIPKYDQRPLDRLPLVDHSTTASDFSVAPIRFLVQMYWGKFPEVFNEWLHFFAQFDLDLAHEALPFLLSMATRYPLTRGLTKRVLSERGHWLVENGGNQEWQWSLHVRTEKPRQQKYEKQEHRVANIIRRDGNTNLGLRSQILLKSLLHPWSPNFSARIIAMLEQVLNRNRRLTALDLVNLMDTVQHGLDPRFKEQLIDLFANYPCQISDMQRALIIMKSLLNFRSVMRKAFEQV